MAGFLIGAARTATEIEAVRHLFAAYAASLPVDLAVQDFETELATLPGKYAEPAGALLLAQGPERKALGCVALRPIAAAGFCEIKRLYVAPGGRGLGLGRALIEAIVCEAGRIGYREVCLDTLPFMVEAIALYRKLGFMPVAPYSEAAIPGTIFFGRPLET